MNRQYIDSLRARLAGRNKRDLIEGMIARSPHDLATEKMLLALEPYPLLLLMLAHDYPTKIWILDRGERLSSSEILTEEMRCKRWHSDGIGIDECEGLTDVAEGYVAVVVSWKTLLIMRHEFAHATTTFLSAKIRRGLEQLFGEAKARGSFTEPLAGESLGEYIACGMSYFLSPDLRQELRDVDLGLHDLVEDILAQAEAVSQEIGEFNKVQF
ncbi:MAG: hypothetical protein M1358_19905 [Chloroflexi bacterium]|nr:hypothetical protein [Chloroflexota bacterium]